jgi:hypothetical protein
MKCNYSAKADQTAIATDINDLPIYQKKLSKKIIKKANRKDNQKINQGS